MGPHPVEHQRALRVIGDGLDRGSRVDEVNVGARGDVTHEAVDDAERVLKRVPARDLEHERLTDVERASAVGFDLRPDLAGRPVHPGEARGRASGLTRADIRGVEDRGDGRVVELLVLR